MMQKLKKKSIIKNEHYNQFLLKNKKQTLINFKLYFKYC